MALQSISFDIITAPDLVSGCRLYGLEGLEPHAISNVMFYKQRQQNGCDSLPLHLQRLVSVSLVIAEQGKFDFVQLQNDDEAQLLTELFSLLDSESCRIYWQQQQLLPLLQFRALQHGVVLPKDWPLLENSPRRALQCGWFDLKQMLCAQGEGNTLAEMAALAALPSQQGVATSLCREIEDVQQLQKLQNGSLANALHIYLLYIRLATIQGVLNQTTYQERLASIQLQLNNSDIPLLARYARAWLAH